MTLDVRLKEVYTVVGVSINIDGVAQVKIKGEDEAIRTAAERFLGRTEEQIKSIALQTVEGHLRAIVGTLSVEDIYKNRDVFAQKVQEVSAGDLANMGLGIDSFTVRDIRDDHGYLDALGKPRVAQVKRDAIIAQADADRDALIRSSQAHQAGQEAKFEADTKVAEANQNFEVKKATYQININQKKAEADLAYDLQKYKTNQAVKAEEIQVMVVEKERMISVQEKEIARRQKELDATINKPADAEKYKIETLANAQRYKIMTEADGHANATKSIGIGEAEANRAKGLAEANVILATGTSEAEAMAKKAESWKAYNQAAVTQLIIEKLPELARAIAEPLAKTEKIVVINSGGESAGASKITKDVTNVIAQLPPVIEALSGIKLEDLVTKLPKLGDPNEKQE
jgi:flotillin